MRNNDSAFPVGIETGLTKREYFIGLVLQGLLSNPKRLNLWNTEWKTFDYIKGIKDETLQIVDAINMSEGIGDHDNALVLNNIQNVMRLNEELRENIRQAIRALEYATDDNGLEVSPAAVECIIDDLKNALKKSEVA